MELHLQWVHSFPPLKPAYRDKRLQFDAGYEPVVMGQAMFVASSRNDSVTAIDTETGELLWRFYTDGPVRFAPVAWNRRVYFGSDDGCLYCLDAGSGTLQWKHTAVPSDRKVLGNGRLISVWPIRGGPVLADDVLYFAAGVWPFEGVFIGALDAADGRIIWRNERTGFLYGKHPHGADALGGVSPQGYLVVHGDTLIVPCGAAVPAHFDRRTGELKSFVLPTAGRVPGGWFASLDDTKEGRDRRRGVITPDSEVNQAQHEDKFHTGPGTPGIGTRITVGDRQLRFRDGFEGVTGEVHTMLAADDKLFVVSRNGKVHCFAPKPSTPRQSATTVSRLEVPDAWRNTAVRILDASGVRNGYALALGLGSGRLVEALARESNLHIIVVEPDRANVEACRRRLESAGLYGTRIVCYTGDPIRHGLPPYFANLIVSEGPDAANLVADATRVGRMFAVLRPYGGVAYLPLPARTHGAFEAMVRKAKLAGASVRRDGEYTILSRPGPLPGSANYTGEWSSSDERVKAPVGLLWFGDEVAHFKRSPQPWIVDGVLIGRHKDWLGAPLKMGSVARMHLPGSTRFPLTEATFQDVYTGRALSVPETSARRRSLAEDLGRPEQPYQYRPPWVSKSIATSQPAHSGPPFTVPLSKGHHINPLTGVREPRAFLKTYGCDGGVDYGYLITMRSGTAAFYDKRIESGTIAISGPRSGCTNSVIPANGLLNVPYFFAGCSCAYALPVGLALVSMPQDYEQWTAWGNAGHEPIRRVGINLGAPGDRMTESGTLWLDYPSVGGPSPKIAVTTEPKDPTFYYRHSVFMKGGQGRPWVGASGAEGLTAITIAGLRKAKFIVRLCFAEPDVSRTTPRVFAVAVQGNPVLPGINVTEEAGGAMRGVIKEFPGVESDGKLTISLVSKQGPPILSGIELIAAGLPLDTRSPR